MEEPNLVLDKGGYLVDRSDWNEAVATILAHTEGLVLSEEHWSILYFLRDFYQSYHSMPTVRTLVKQMAHILTLEKANSLYLHTLFPSGVLQQAAKIAGLPRPACCL